MISEILKRKCLLGASLNAFATAYAFSAVSILYRVNVHLADFRACTAVYARVTVKMKP